MNYDTVARVDAYRRAFDALHVGLCRISTWALGGRLRASERLLGEMSGRRSQEKPAKASHERTKIKRCLGVSGDVSRDVSRRLRVSSTEITYKIM